MQTSNGLKMLSNSTSNTSDTTGKTLLVVSSAIFMLLGLVYVIAPLVLVAPFGIVIEGAKGLTEIRAVFGGFQCGVAVFLCWSCFDNSRLEAGLMALFCFTVAMAGCRGLGLIISGQLDFHVLAIVFESVWAALAYYSLYRRNKPAAS